MKYVGMQTQISRNNMLSLLLLLLFPVIILAMVWVCLALINYFGHGYYDADGEFYRQLDVDTVNYYFLEALPWVVGIVGIWFAIAYFANASMIQRAVRARPLTRKENARVYNIVENLCMTCNMDMPAIYVVDDDELAGVIGHELTHIRNRDTRLLITSIVFVGIVSTVMMLAARTLYAVMWSGGTRSRSRGKDDRNGLSIMFVVLVAVIVCAAVAYFFTMLTRFAI